MKEDIITLIKAQPESISKQEMVNKIEDYELGYPSLFVSRHDEIIPLMDVVTEERRQIYRLLTRDQSVVGFFVVFSNVLQGFDRSQLVSRSGFSIQGAAFQSSNPIPC